MFCAEILPSLPLNCHILDVESLLFILISSREVANESLSMEDILLIHFCDLDSPSIFGSDVASTKKSI